MDCGVESDFSPGISYGQKLTFEDVEAGSAEEEDGDGTDSLMNMALGT